METLPAYRPHASEATLERELTLVREAIAMVTLGAASRVVLSGLRFGEALVDPARRLAEQEGVRIVPLWAADDAGADIAVEREPDA